LIISFALLSLEAFLFAATPVFLAISPPLSPPITTLLPMPAALSPPIRRRRL